MSAVTFRPATGEGGFVEIGVRDAISGEIVGLISRPCTGAKWLVYGRTGVRPVARMRSRKAAEEFFLNGSGA
jgi:hypothetical protein